MAKFSGIIGFVKTGELVDGVFKPSSVVQKMYRGDILRNTIRYEQSGGVNDDVNISKQISIVADSFIIDNLEYIRYIQLYNHLWKVTSFDVSRPRIILTIGGLYNGEQATTAEGS